MLKETNLRAFQDRWLLILCSENKGIDATDALMVRKLLCITKVYFVAISAALFLKIHYFRYLM